MEIWVELRVELWVELRVKPRVEPRVEPHVELRVELCPELRIPCNEVGPCANARTTVRVWSRSLDPIDSIG
jgi:hypothetical protein